MNVTFQTVGLVPAFPATFKVEEDFDIKANNIWLKQNYHHSLYYSLVYLLAIQAGKAYMKDRAAYSLRWPLIVWNFTLAVFSICGAVRSDHALLHALYHFGFEHSICDNRYILESPVLGFWMGCFVVSKVVELLDTAFVVLRKQKLIFLHWFHHCSVLVFSWFTAADSMAMGRWFISMNYTVHSVMYSYYTLRALKFKIPKPIAMSITSLQLIQMFIGFYVSIKGMTFYLTKPSCKVTAYSAFIAISVYIFYFFLFCNFFVFSYLLPMLASRKAKKQK